MPPNPRRQLFRCGQAAARVVESEGFGFAFEEGEQVVGDFQFAAADIVQRKTFGASSSPDRAARLGVENTTFLGQPCSSLAGESVISSFHIR